MMEKLKGLFLEEEGQGMTEYGLILGLIALAVVAGLTAFSGQISALFNKAENQLEVITGTTD